VNPAAFAALAPLLALAGAVVVGVFGRRWREPLPGVVASVLIGGAFVASVLVAIGLIGRDAGVGLTLWSFMPVAGLDVSVGVLAIRSPPPSC
jgi:NADH:ubiquinone oxidoreductase subunit 5 (subunit L)/multisubunit Na+/H+ antiporter MnhA subunit